MTTTPKIYSNFKPYTSYKAKKANSQKKSIAPVIGSAIGVVGAMALTKKYYKGKSAFVDAARMITMAGAANTGGVLMGSIGATKDSKKRKWKEAGFQMMNMSIPMVMVTSALEICKHIKPLNNKPAKIIGSIIGMVGGAATATKITNIGKPKEQQRKYTIKDSIANFDDVVATIEIGFKDFAQKIPVGKILPFIYGYSGARAGWKE